MSTESPARSYRVKYRDYEPAPTQERIAEVGVFYDHLTGRKVFPSVKGLLAVVTRIHADDTERVMREVFDQIGTDDLLRVLADTERGESPHITEEQRRAKPKAAGRAVASVQKPPLPQPEPDSPVEPEFPPLPSDFAPVSLGHGGNVPSPATPSEPGEGSERPGGRSAGGEASEHTAGFIYGGGQRWDRLYWEREAASRAAEGDLTIAARLTFWEMLSPEEQVLPGPADTSAGRPS